MCLFKLTTVRRQSRANASAIRAFRNSLRVIDDSNIKHGILISVLTVGRLGQIRTQYSDMNKRINFFFLFRFRKVLFRNIFCGKSNRYEKENRRKYVLRIIHLKISNFQKII